MLQITNQKLTSSYVHCWALHIHWSFISFLPC